MYHSLVMKVSDALGNSKSEKSIKKKKKEKRKTIGQKLHKPAAKSGISRNCHTLLALKEVLRKDTNCRLLKKIE